MCESIYRSVHTSTYPSNSLTHSLPPSLTHSLTDLTNINTRTSIKAISTLRATPMQVGRKWRPTKTWTLATQNLCRSWCARARFFGANEEAESHQSLVLESLLEVSYLVIRKSSTNGGYLETSEPMGSFAMVSQVASRYEAFLQPLSWFECSWASRVRILLILGTLSFLNSV